MEYLTLAKMKKLYPSCKTADGKQTVLFDLSDLDKTWFTESVIEQIMPEIIKYTGMNTYENIVFAMNAETDKNHLSIDIEFNITHVYSKKTGKKLYTLKSVSGFRIAEYERNIYGVVPGSATPSCVISYGTLDVGSHAWRKAYSKDIEI